MIILPDDSLSQFLESLSVNDVQRQDRFETLIKDIVLVSF